MFRLVLVMVSLVVQMVGGVGDAAVVLGRGDGMGDPYQVVCEGDVAIGGWCCVRWCC